MIVTRVALDRDKGLKCMHEVPRLVHLQARSKVILLMHAESMLSLLPMLEDERYHAVGHY